MTMKVAARFLFSAVITFSAANNPVSGSDEHHHLHPRELKASSSVTTASLLQTDIAFGNAAADPESSSKVASKLSNTIDSTARRLEKNLTCKKCKSIADALVGNKNCMKKCSKKTEEFKSCDESCCNTLCMGTEDKPIKACQEVGYCSKKVTAKFGFSQIEACKGDDVKVVWKGYHNIQETKKSNCESEDIGEEVLNYYEAGYKKTFKKNELSAAPGETRYFKCSSHCGDEVNRIKVTCPAPPVTAEFGFSKIEACEGDAVKVIWQGFHNIQETKNSKGDSEDIGEEVEGYNEAEYEKTFEDDELSAAPGKTRYFKCTSHCGENMNRIEVSCPE